MGDKRFDQITTGILQRLRAAEIGGIGLHESGIEIVLTNQKAELITQTRMMTIG